MAASLTKSSVMGAMPSAGLRPARLFANRLRHGRSIDGRGERYCENNLSDAPASRRFRIDSGDCQF